MRVLVACEFSAIVRDAFRAEGHEAWSCDLRPTEGSPRWHIRGDAVEAVEARGWDMLIAHPPCTYLANSGVRWLYEKEGRWCSMVEAAVFFRRLLQSDVPRVAIENPVVHKWARKIIGRGPDFTVQPWQFGHGETKRICWWTRGLPDLEPTEVVEGREARVHRMPPGEDRQKERSRFYTGLAEAMARQWG